MILKNLLELFLKDTKNSSKTNAKELPDSLLLITEKIYKIFIIIILYIIKFLNKNMKVEFINTIKIIGLCVKIILNIN